MRLICLLFLLAFALPAAAADAPKDAWQQAERLGRGVNVLGYDPLWRDPAKARFQPRHFKLIREAGFRHIRINLHAFAHMDPEHRLDRVWLETLDQVVRQSTAAGLMVILDLHDFRSCGENADACSRLVLAFWRQVAERFRDAPDSVLFELLNEPNRQMTSERWNSLLAETLAVVRASNPSRTVLVGTVQSNSIRQLPSLLLPRDDRNLIVTVHYYDPYKFTHQGAGWTNLRDLSGVAWGRPDEQARIEADFDAAQAWSRAEGRPIHLGEFGVYDRAAMLDRVAWTAAVARAAERRGWPWAYWQFTGDFVLYDLQRDEWVRPILEALTPAP